MRTKLVAYAVAAVLVGLAVMVMPRALETEVLQPSSPETYQAESDTNGQRNVLPAGGLASQPSNLVPSSLILLAGFVAAFSAYIIFRKLLG
jgi:hypothetical protein